MQYKMDYPKQSFLEMVGSKVSENLILSPERWWFLFLQLSDHNFKEFFVDLKRNLALQFYAKAADTIWTRKILIEILFKK